MESRICQDLHINGEEVNRLDWELQQARERREAVLLPAQLEVSNQCQDLAIFGPFGLPFAFSAPLNPLLKAWLSRIRRGRQRPLWVVDARDRTFVGFDAGLKKPGWMRMAEVIRWNKFTRKHHGLMIVLLNDSVLRSNWLGLGARYHLLCAVDLFTAVTLLALFVDDGDRPGIQRELLHRNDHGGLCSALCFSTSDEEYSAYCLYE